MYIGKVAGIKIKLNNFFIMLMILMGFFGMLIDSILIFIVVIVHELGHVTMARRLKYKVESVELLPIGGVANIYEDHYKKSSDEWFIAGAGPFNNLLFIILIIYFRDHIPYSRTLMEYNLTLFFFNLLPALPLDGGRLLKAHLAKNRSAMEAKKIAASIGVLIGLSMLGLTVYYYINSENNFLYFALLGLFLTISAFKEFKESKYLPIRMGMSKEERMAKITEGKLIICPLNTRVNEIMRQVETNRELVICIIDEKGEVVDMITEKLVVYHHNKGKGNQTLENILAI